MLANMFGFHGRIGRLQFLLYGFVAFIMVTVATIICIGIVISGHGQGFAAILIPMLIGMALISASVLAITAKRLHDLDLSGWHAVWIFGLHLASQGMGTQGGVIAMFCKIFSGLLWLFLLLWPGTPGPNSSDGVKAEVGNHSRPSNDPVARLNFGQRA